MYLGLFTILVTLLASCGVLWTAIPNSSPVHYNYFAYLADSNPNNLDGFKLDPSTGLLTLMTSGIPANISTFVSGLTTATLSSTKVEILANTLCCGGGAYGYLVNAQTGALTSVPNSPISGNNNNPFVYPLDPLNRFFYGINANTVYASLLNPATGAFSPVPSSIATGNTPMSIAVDKSGNYIYVADSVGGDIRTYNMNTSTGALSVNSTYVTAAGNGAYLLIDPQGRFLFDIVSQCASNDTIYSFKVNGDGTLTANGGIAGTNEMCGGVLGYTLDNTGKFLYEGAGPTDIFSINQVSGALTNVGSVPAGGFMFVDSTNAYLLFVNLTLSSYTGVSTGSLLATGFSSPVSNAAGNSYFDPTGQFIYVLDNVNNKIYEFRFNYSNGAITPLSTSPITTIPSPLAMTFAKVAY